jgi:hypothetical protein
VLLCWSPQQQLLHPSHLWRPQEQQQQQQVLQVLLHSAHQCWPQAQKQPCHCLEQQLLLWQDLQQSGLYPELLLLGPLLLGLLLLGLQAAGHQQQRLQDDLSSTPRHCSTSRC